VYGPTEGTCICSSYDITEKDFKDLKELPSLGTINQNFSYEILKEKNQKKGELIIIGPSISPGYYNDSERSEKVFGTYKKGEYYLNRFYRTGDLVEEKKGLLYFIGRVDNQIKHMGYRIELEEIENGMNRVLGIQESAAIYKRVNDSYGKIYAYVVCKNLSQEEIKKNLKEYLPTYMIPNKIIMLNVLPKNQNGKIDRKALLIF
jgi:D-alanine--poly(phosphoribitol) ligase subunit 1